MNIIHFVGIDIGSYSTYVAGVYKSGPEIILGESGSRFTPTCVSFRENTCFIGALAEQKRIQNLQNTATNLTRLLGKAEDDEIVLEEKVFIKYKIANSNGKVVIMLTKNNKEENIFVESLIALQISHVLRVSNVQISETAGDFVFNVPTYFAQNERVAMINSIILTGIPYQKIKLINDTTAIGLMYGFYRTGTIKESINVAFVSLGHANLQIAIIKFQEKGLQVLSTACNSCLGSRNFTQCLYSHFEKQLQCLLTDKSKARLMKSCDKLKILLGQAPLEMTVKLPCDLGSDDVTLSITRKEFENLPSVQSIIEKIKFSLNEALEGLSEKDNNIFKIELVGGGGRIPAVQACVKRIFHKPTSATLNSDEVIARGCSLLSALYSDSTKRNEYKLIDKYHHAIKLKSGQYEFLYETSRKLEQIQVQKLSFMPLKLIQNQNSSKPTITVDYEKSTIKKFFECKLSPYIDINGLILLRSKTKDQPRKLSKIMHFGLTPEVKEISIAFLKNVNEEMAAEQKRQELSNQSVELKLRLANSLEMVCVEEKHWIRSAYWKTDAKSAIGTFQEQIEYLNTKRSVKNSFNELKLVEKKLHEFYAKSKNTLKAIELMNTVYHKDYVPIESNVIVNMICQTWSNIETELQADFFIKVFKQMDMNIEKLFAFNESCTMETRKNSIYGFSLEQLQFWFELVDSQTLRALQKWKWYLRNLSIDIKVTLKEERINDLLAHIDYYLYKIGDEAQQIINYCRLQLPEFCYEQTICKAVGKTDLSAYQYFKNICEIYLQIHSSLPKTKEVFNNHCGYFYNAVMTKQITTFKEITDKLNTSQ